MIPAHNSPIPFNILCCAMVGTGGELLQLAEPASPLAIIIESAFMEASQLVLDTLKTQFKLYENFQGLRRYMLMGQGDFFRYLMQLLE